jgi:hypothetical protein
MFGQKTVSLRGNGKTVGSIEDRLSSAQDWLSEVDRSCLLASSPKRVAELTVNKAKSSLVQAGSQGVRVDKSAITVSHSMFCLWKGRTGRK